MLRRVAAAYPRLRDGGFILARQENLETIHRHSVVAERSGELSEIVAELESGEHSRHHMTMREWLAATCSRVFALPSQLAAITTPRSAAIARRPVTASSRAMITIPTHAASRSSDTSEISAAITSSLSASGSMSLP